jgi:hypothetical protein
MLPLYTINPTLFHAESITTIGVRDSIYGMDLQLAHEVPDVGLNSPMWFKVIEHNHDHTYTHIMLSTFLGNRPSAIPQMIPDDLRLIYSVIKTPQGNSILYNGHACSAFREQPNMGLNFMVLDQLKYDLSGSFNLFNQTLSEYVDRFARENVVGLALSIPTDLDEIMTLLNGREQLYSSVVGRVADQVDMNEFLSNVFLKTNRYRPFGMLHSVLQHGTPVKYLESNRYSMQGGAKRVMLAPGQPEMSYNPHLHALDTPQGMAFIQACYRLITRTACCFYDEFSLTFQGARQVLLNFVVGGGDRCCGCNVGRVLDISDPLLQSLQLPMAAIWGDLEMLIRCTNPRLSTEGLYVTICKSFNEVVLISLVNASGLNHTYYFDIPLTVLHGPMLAHPIYM